MHRPTDGLCMYLSVKWSEIVRIIKEYDERRIEILDAAESLFETKGYEKCTVNDIIKEVSIAKGTFYYYFKSKQDVLDAIVLRYKEIIVGRTEKILEKNIGPEKKLLKIFKAMRLKDKTDDKLLEELHKSENALLHQKSLNQIVTALTPILAKVIAEGIEKKVWSCKYPLEYMEIFLVAALTLTDEGMFRVDDDSRTKIMTALITVLEKMLELPEDALMKLYMEN